MLAALLTTLLFATSAVCGYRTARQIGGRGEEQRGRSEEHTPEL